MNKRSLMFVEQALRNLVSKPRTQKTLERGEDWTEANRGHIEIDPNTCILCGMCMRRCPSGAIAVDRKESYWSINRFACVQCGCCIDVCPKSSLRFDPLNPVPGVDNSIFEKVAVDVPQRPAPPRHRPAGGPETAGADKEESR